MEPADKFETKLAAYIEWRKGVSAICGQPVPGDIAALLHEQSRLEPLRYQAEDWRSWAVAAYYKRKATLIEQYWAEVAKTALHDVAKAQAYKELWARENAHGTAEAIISRRFTVAQELKRLGHTN